MKHNFISILIIAFLLVGTVSAFDFDNVKSYDDATKTVTIKNAFGLPLIGDTLLTARLDTQQHNIVGLGYQRVAEITVDPNIDLANIIKSFELYDVKTGKRIGRQIDLKYKTTELFSVPDISCTPYKNGTIGETCITSGAHFEPVEIWKEFNGEVYSKTPITIGLYTDVELGDYVEWIPTIAGVKIDEWATWSGNIATGLAGYWSFDGSAMDNTTNHQHNGTLVNGNGLAWKSGANCIINGCLDLLASNDYVYIGTALGNGYDDYSDDTTTAWSLNFWIKKPASGTGGDAGFITKNNPPNTTTPFSLAGDGATGFYTRYDGQALAWHGKPPLLVWTMQTVNWNTTHFNWYSNGTLINSTAVAHYPVANDSSIIIGFYGAVGGGDGNFSIDEMGWWNRSLTQDEITFLWNGGSGRAYEQEDTIMSVTLNSPADASSILNVTTTFNSTMSPAGYALTNATLFLWYSNGTLYDAVTNTSFSGNFSYIDYSNWKFGSYYWNVFGVMGNGAGINSSWGTSNYTLNVVRATADTQNYNTPVLEQSSQTFIMNASVSSGLSVSYINLEYNGTNYTASFTSLNSTTYRATRVLTVPSVTADGTSAFSWFLIFTDGSGIETSSLNQSVLNFNIDNCSTNTIQIMNLTLKDEDNQTTLSATPTNTSIELNLLLYSYANLSGNYINYSKKYSQINPARVCINDSLANSTYYMNAQIKYTANEHAIEYYNIQNYSLNASSNPSENMSLYDLLSSNNQPFVIKYKDKNYLAVANALIQISRKYVDEGAFKTVEVPITDTGGSAVGNLEVDTVIYTFTVTKEGEVLAVFNNYLAKCQNPTITTCEINLNAFQSSIPVTNYTVEQDFLYTLTYSNSTRTVTATFTIPSGASSFVSLNVTKEDALGTSVCNQSITTSSGTLNCVVGSNFGNGTVVAYLYKDTLLVAKGQINLQQTPSQIFGNGLILLGIFILLALIGASLSDNPVVMIVSFMFGVIMLFSLNLVAHSGFIGSGATILFLIIAIIIILVKASRRN